MNLLAEIDDHSLGLNPEPDTEKSGYGERQAARAVIFNPDGDVALLHAANIGYYKLPGGGIDPGEDWQAAVVRECLEETGYTVELRPQELGQIIEWRAQPEDWRPQTPKLRQVSFCGVANAIGTPVEIALEADEIAQGLTLQWHPLDKAIALVRQYDADDYEGQFICVRDLTFLEEALRLGLKA